MAFITTKIEKFRFTGSWADEQQGKLNTFFEGTPLSFSNNYGMPRIIFGNLNTFLFPGGDGTVVTDIIKFDNGWFIFFTQLRDGTIIEMNYVSLIKFSDKDFYLSSSRYGGHITGGTAKWAFTVQAPDNYVAFAPLISVSNDFASGVTVDGVYLQSGIKSNVWSKDGLVINGHTFYGANEFCVCTD